MAQRYLLNIREDSNLLCQHEVLRELERLGKLNEEYQNLASKEMKFVNQMKRDDTEEKKEPQKQADVQIKSKSKRAKLMQFFTRDKSSKQKGK